MDLLIKQFEEKFHTSLLYTFSANGILRYVFKDHSLVYGKRETYTVDEIKELTES